MSQRRAPVAACLSELQRLGVPPSGRPDVFGSWVSCRRAVPNQTARTAGPWGDLGPAGGPRLGPAAATPQRPASAMLVTGLGACRPDRAQNRLNLRLEAERPQFIVRHKLPLSNRPGVLARPMRVKIMIVLCARLHPAFFFGKHLYRLSYP
jgi:hypothetical protein